MNEVLKKLHIEQRVYKETKRNAGLVKRIKPALQIVYTFNCFLRRIFILESGADSFPSRNTAADCALPDTNSILAVLPCFRIFYKIMLF